MQLRAQQHAQRFAKVLLGHHQQGMRVGKARDKSQQRVNHHQQGGVAHRQRSRKRQHVSIRSRIQIELHQRLLPGAQQIGFIKRDRHRQIAQRELNPLQPDGAAGKRERVRAGTNHRGAYGLRRELHVHLPQPRMLMQRRGQQWPNIRKTERIRGLVAVALAHSAGKGYHLGYRACGQQAGLHQPLRQRRERAVDNFDDQLRHPPRYLR